jgi:uncharacterized membrane protein
MPTEQVIPAGTCTHCGAQLPEVGGFCPGCGIPISGGAPVAARSTGLRESLLGALAYVTVIPAIIFLRLDPYKKSRFIRFHSCQCIFVTAAALVLWIALRLLAAALLLLPEGLFLVVLFTMLAVLGCLVIWSLLLLKALQGEFFKLPWIGNLAEKQADRG